MPGDIRLNLTFLREDLLDEGKTPKPSPNAYTFGADLFDKLLAASKERNQTAAKADFRAVEAAARTGGITR